MQCTRQRHFNSEQWRRHHCFRIDLSIQTLYVYSLTHTKKRHILLLILVKTTSKILTRRWGIFYRKCCSRNSTNCLSWNLECIKFDHSQEKLVNLTNFVGFHIFGAVCMKMSNQILSVFWWKYRRFDNRESEKFTYHKIDSIHLLNKWRKNDKNKSKFSKN